MQSIHTLPTASFPVEFPQRAVSSCNMHIQPLTCFQGANLYFDFGDFGVFDGRRWRYLKLYLLPITLWKLSLLQMLQISLTGQIQGTF